jgi:predicted DCC family thiol-disulfide oxidoreductase YuxK
MQNTSNWKLLYDGECEMCIRFSGLVRKFDDRQMIEVIPYQRYSEEGGEIPLQELEKEVHLISETEVLKGSDAVCRLIELLPPLKPFRWMIENRAGKGLARIFYRMANGYRKRCKTCRKR